MAAACNCAGGQGPCHEGFHHILSLARLDVTDLLYFKQFVQYFAEFSTEPLIKRPWPERVLLAHLAKRMHLGAMEATKQLRWDTSRTNPTC